MSSPRKVHAPAAEAPLENLLGTALRGLSEGVIIVERALLPDGLKIIFANAAFCRMVGYSEAELMGRGHGFLHLAEDDPARLQQWHRTLARDKSLQGEGPLRHSKDETPYAAWTFRPLANGSGKITHIVATYRDITEKHRLQEALLHSQRLDAVGRLAGGVAHDFNNLISVINGYCEILSDTLAGNAKARREIAEIHSAGQKAAALVRQLLAFSRRQALEPKVVNLNQLIRDNAGILERLLQHDKSLALALDDTIGNVRADPSQLQQVILNLCINARDALGPGGRVTIGTARRDIKTGNRRRATDMPPGHYVLLSVSDNGSGMDDATQTHLFEPFFTTKEEGKGTGLGLALVYGVVQQSGGYIFVQSAPRIGSTFEIYLPEIREVATARSGSLPPLPVTRGKESLLVVEEDDVVRKMVAGILTADGYQVAAIKTAAEGLHAMDRFRHPVHLVCVDHADRHGDGARLVHALREAHPHLRVVCTPNEERPGLADFPPERQTSLPKPFALSALLKAVRGLLDAP